MNMIISILQVGYVKDTQEWSGKINKRTSSSTLQYLVKYRKARQARLPDFQRTGLARYPSRAMLIIAIFFCYCLEAITRTFVGGVYRAVWKM